MEFLIKLITVSFMGTFALFGALGSDNQWPGLIVAISIWLWFIYSLSEPEKSSRHTIRQQEGRIGNFSGYLSRKVDF